MVSLFSISVVVLPGDKGLHEEQGWSNWHEQDVGKDTDIMQLFYSMYESQRRIKHLINGAN